MPLITGDTETHQSEDQTYLNVALEHVAQAKDAHRRDDFTGALKSLQRAMKRMQELIALRKESNPDYSVLEAPLFYLQGHFLVSYIE